MTRILKKNDKMFIEIGSNLYEASIYDVSLNEYRNIQYYKLYMDDTAIEEDTMTLSEETLYNVILSTPEELYESESKVKKINLSIELENKEISKKEKALNYVNKLTNDDDDIMEYLVKQKEDLEKRIIQQKNSIFFKKKKIKYIIEREKIIIEQKNKIKLFLKEKHE